MVVILYTLNQLFQYPNSSDDLNTSKQPIAYTISM